MTTRLAERRRTAETNVTEQTDDLQELEQELLDEVAKIDASWREKTIAVERASIRLEATDVHVVQLALVWVPTS